MLAALGGCGSQRPSEREAVTLARAAWGQESCVFDEHVPWPCSQLTDVWVSNAYEDKYGTGYCFKVTYKAETTRWDSATHAPFASRTFVQMDEPLTACARFRRTGLVRHTWIFEDQNHQQAKLNEALRNALCGEGTSYVCD